MRSGYLLSIICGRGRAFSGTSKKYDLAIVGGGPGGYTTAIKAAQSGLKVACIERRKTLGGTCLNCGCIPSKILLNVSHSYEAAKRGLIGVKNDGVEFDLDKIMRNKETHLKQLNMGILGLFKKNGVDFVNGHASLVSPTQLLVNGTEKIDSKDIILAPGSEVVPFPGDSLKIDGKDIVSSDEAICFEKVPERLIVIGGGAIGLELASIWNRFGSKVTILEYASSLCPVMDQDTCLEIKRILEKQGIEIHVGAKVLGGKRIQEGKVLVTADKGRSELSVEGDKVLVAMGRRPYTKNLGLEKLGIATKNGRISVDDRFRVEGHESIRAIGDVISGPMLAHKAEEDGSIALESILGARDAKQRDYTTIPSVIYTHPEISGVGLTEQECIKRGIDYKKSKFPFAANSRAKTAGEGEGFVKILADARSHEILGGWILGPHASELIVPIVLAVSLKLSTEALTSVSFAHPSLSEAVKEACQGIHSRATHI